MVGRKGERSPRLRNKRWLKVGIWGWDGSHGVITVLRMKAVEEGGGS